MTVKSLNPNHPALANVTPDLWPKLLVILMNELGLTHLVITEAMVASMRPDTGISIQHGDNGDGNLHIRLHSPEEAAALARREGGLPL